MSTEKKLQEFVAIEDLNSVIQKIIRENFLKQKSTVRVLEAGCGSLSHIAEDPTYQLDGIDISQKQLDRNKNLKQKILGDIQTHPFPKSIYDMIVCFWVLEHVDNPELALQNFMHALREGGIIVIGVPNVMSLKGLVTKYTPHWFHIFVYRYIFNYKLAGIDDNPPFHTTLKYSISPNSVLKCAKQNNLTAIYFNAFEDFRQEELREKLKIHNIIWNFLNIVFKILTFGKIQLKSTSYVVVLQK